MRATMPLRNRDAACFDAATMRIRSGSSPASIRRATVSNNKLVTPEPAGPVNRHVPRSAW